MIDPTNVTVTFYLRVLRLVFNEGLHEQAVRLGGVTVADLYDWSLSKGSPPPDMRERLIEAYGLPDDALPTGNLFRQREVL